MSNEQPTECVGTLLVHTSDMKELSEATAPVSRNTNKSDEQVECVGSLLVHSSDVKELSDSSPTLPAVNLRQRISVGTLLVTQDDVRSPPDHEEHVSKGVSIQKRITKKMEGPSPGDEEADTWAD